MDKLPELVLPKEVLDAPHTLGVLKGKYQKDLYVDVTFQREKRVYGKLEREKYTLRCRVEGFFINSMGVEYVDLSVEDPKRPLNFPNQQKMKASLLPATTVERTKAALQMLSEIAS